MNKCTYMDMNGHCKIEECVHMEKTCDARMEKCEFEEKGHCTLNECIYGDFLVTDDSRFGTGKYCFCNGVTDEMKETRRLKEQK